MANAEKGNAFLDSRNRQTQSGDELGPSPDHLSAKAAALTADTDPTTIEKIAVDAAALPPIAQRRVLDTIKRQTGIPFGTLQAVIRKQSAGGDTDHLALARQVRAGIGYENMLASDDCVWRWHEAGVWRPAEVRAVRGLVQNHIADTGKQVTKGLVDSVTDLLTTDIYRPEHQFDGGNPETVNTPSGELVLGNDGWSLQPHQREHYRTTQIPVAYDPAAHAPRFLQFLKEIFPDADGEQKAQAVLEMMGYTLLAHSRHERFVILVGAGANGKSVLLAVLEALCGHENVAGVQPSQFGNRFQRGHLHLKLANVVTEIEQGAVMDDAALKGITSGEPTTVEHKFRNPFQMRPFSTCWFGTNHMPHTRDFSDALFRRALVLQFNAVFKPEHGNHDPNLQAKLIDELPGILNLALAHYSKAMRDGLTIPESSERARKEWRLEADQVAQFVEVACEVDADVRQKPQDLFNDYLKWAKDSGIHRTMSEPGFRSRLQALGFERTKRNGVRWFIGLRSTYLFIE